MSSKTRIVVFHMKEIIYTAIFIGLAILLICLLFVMFHPKKSETPARSASYIPGVYTSSLTLGNQNLNVEVTVDDTDITSVSFVSLDEAVTTMYPLMEPVMADLENQILAHQSTEDLSYSMETRYTAQVLLNAIDNALQKARID